MSWKSTLFLLLSAFFVTNLVGQSCGEAFYDTGGDAANYADNEDLSWTICPDNAGDVVTIDFTLIDVETCCDNLGVYNGSTTDVAFNADVETPESFTSFADDGCLTVTWASDGSVNLPGWEANITCAAAPACSAPLFFDAVANPTGATLSWAQPGSVALWDLEIGTAGFAPTGTPTNAGVDSNPYVWSEGGVGESYDAYVRASCGDDGMSEWVGPVSFTVLPGCGSLFTDSNAGVDGTYDNNEDMMWTFCPDTPGEQVTLNFTMVEVEGCCDPLAVYNGSDLSNPLNADVEAPESFTSNAADGCLTVTFSSDGSVTFAGWEANIICAPAPPCPNPSDLTSSDATPVGATLAWTENGEATAWNIEIVETGTAPTGTATVTGVGNPYTWEGGEGGTEYQYYVNADCGDGETSYWVGPFTFATLPACGGSFFDTGGSEGTYQNNENLEWTFCPDTPGDQVTINFIMVDVEGCCDPLAVYNGSDLSNPLNADLEAPESFTSNTDDGCLTVTFSSDGSVTNAGWEAIVTCNPPPPCPNPSDLTASEPTLVGATLAWTENGEATSWNIEVVEAGTAPTGTATVTGVGNPYTWEGGQGGIVYEYYVNADCGDGETSYWIGPFAFVTLPACGGSFFDTGGPNGNYQFNENETWTLCPDTPGEIAVLDFITVDVSFFWDNLAVYNGSTTDEPLSLDVELPTTFISTAADGCLTVTFTSSGFTSQTGWEAAFNCTTCPPVLAQDVTIDDVNAFDAEISWATAIMNGMYSIEYDTLGFTQGEGQTTTGNGNAATITGLEENTTYEFYLSFFCEDETLSATVGPYEFTTIFNHDLGITGLVNPSADCGLGSNETIEVAIHNFGAAPQTLFPLNYSVNGVLAGVGQPQDGFYTGIVSNDSTRTFEFDLEYDFDIPGDYTISVWTEFEDDANMMNDTFTITLTRYGVPFFEDFEGGEIPAYMETTGDEFVTTDHNNTSFVYADNLFTVGDSLKAGLPVLGPISEDDILYFDYRYTVWSAGTEGAVLAESDRLIVYVSTDCGETYEEAFLLTGNNHEPSAEFATAEVPLGDYAGSNVKIEIVGVRGTGDNWLDIDNINIPSCANINAQTSVVNASAEDVADGEATVTPYGGIAPYTVEWNDGGQGEERTGLEVGTYTVTITDAMDCVREIEVVVDVMVSTAELPELVNALNVMPNPTSSIARVQAEFVQALDARVEVVNMLGQVIWQSQLEPNTTTLNVDVDLTDAPAAIYLVRLYAADQLVTRKVMKTN